MKGPHAFASITVYDNPQHASAHAVKGVASLCRMCHRRNHPLSGCLVRPMLPSGLAAGAPAVQLPSLSVPLSAAAAGLSADQRTAEHPAVQLCLKSKQDGMTCL